MRVIQTYLTETGWLSLAERDAGSRVTLTTGQANTAKPTNAAVLAMVAALPVAALPAEPVDPLLGRLAADYKALKVRDQTAILLKLPALSQLAVVSTATVAEVG